MRLPNLNNHQPNPQPRQKRTHRIPPRRPQRHRQPTQQRTRQQRPEDRDPEKVLLERVAEARVRRYDAHAVEADERCDGEQENHVPEELDLGLEVHGAVWRVAERVGLLLGDGFGAEGPGV